METVQFQGQIPLWVVFANRLIRLGKGSHYGDTLFRVDVSEEMTKKFSDLDKTTQHVWLIYRSKA